MKAAHVDHASPLCSLARALVPSVGCVSVPDDGKQPDRSRRTSTTGATRSSTRCSSIASPTATSNNDYTVQPGALARYQGGDWQGIDDHLDYLKTLGVTTLWISPVVKNVETDADFDALPRLLGAGPHAAEPALRRSRGAPRARSARAHDTRHQGDPRHRHQPHGAALLLRHQRERATPTSTSAAAARCRQRLDVADHAHHRVRSRLRPARRAGLHVARHRRARADHLHPRPGDQPRRRRPGILGTRARVPRLRPHPRTTTIATQRTLGDFPGGLKDVATELPDVRARDDRRVRALGRARRLRRLPHRHGQARRARVLAGVRARAFAQRLAPQGKKNFLMFGEAFDGNDELLGSYTQHGDARQRLLLLAALPGLPRRLPDTRTTRRSRRAPSRSRTSGRSAPTNYGNEPQTDGIGIAPSKALVNFLDNHDVARFLFDAAGDKDGAPQRAHAPHHGGGHPLPLLRHRAGVRRRQRSGEPRGAVEHRLRRRPATRSSTSRSSRGSARRTRRSAAATRTSSGRRTHTARRGRRRHLRVRAHRRRRGERLRARRHQHERAARAANRDGAKAMKLTARAEPLVDVLDPAQPTYTVAADGTLRMQVPAQRATILIPQDQVVPLP